MSNSFILIGDNTIAKPVLASTKTIPAEFPAIQNEAREGSFKRGAETALGGGLPITRTHMMNVNREMEEICRHSF